MPIVGHIYTSICYCCTCKSLTIPLYDVMVGKWIASYVFIIIFWSRCCCFCCVLLLLPTTSVLKRREIPPTVDFLLRLRYYYYCCFICTYILLMLLLSRRDMHFYFLVEVLLLLIIFLVGCTDAAAGARAAHNISTEAERGTGYCFFLPRLSFTLRCFGRLLLQLFLAASISVI